MQQLTTLITDGQKEWLNYNSISLSQKSNGKDGKTQAQHVRDALDEYIKKYKEE